MREIKPSKRKLLTAGLGVAVYTAFEGLACGNPVEPRCPTEMACPDARVDAPVDGRVDAVVLDAATDAATDAAVDADIDAAVDVAPDRAPAGKP
jgi:hypothetical protein